MHAGKTANSEQRSFGLVVAGGFAVIALWPAVFRSQSPRMWALGLAVGLSALALVAPPVLEPFRRVWMIVGEGLGWVNTRVILGVVYYGLIVPIGAIRRMRGTDPMQRQIERNAMTYKVIRSQRPASHMRRQY
jgi:Saxitoxin biosynthesis operon protein SxtJ